MVIFLRPTWLHIPGCLALGEWSHHRYYLGHNDLFCIVLLCILLTSLPFLSFIVPIFAWNVPLVSVIFLKLSLVFPILFFFPVFLGIGHWGRLSYLSCYSLELCIQVSISLQASSVNHFAFLHFFLLMMMLITASCTMSQTFIHSTLGTMSITSNPLSLFIISFV